MTLDIQKFKHKLEEEKKTLEGELKRIGRVNPSNPADWEAVPDKIDILPGDENETADLIESYEGNTAILKQLESQLLEVNHALSKIEEGTYGICEVSGEEIEEERLEANPAARTNLAHLNDKI